MPKQVWQAEDVTQFQKEKDCLIYEKFQKKLKRRVIPQEIRRLVTPWDSDPIKGLAKTFMKFPLQVLNAYIS